MGDVRFKFIRFEDCTGLATHVQLELMEFVGTRVGIRAFTLPLMHGLKKDDPDERETVAILKPVAMNVFELHLQPMVSTRPGEIVPLGQPLSVQVFPGQFIVSASLEFRGQLIRRTIVDELVVASEDMPDFPPIETDEVSFSYFDYHDQVGGAGQVDLLIVGSLNGAPSDAYTVSPLVVPHGGVVRWPIGVPSGLSDVVSFRFTVYSPGTGDVQYGQSVLQEASQGLFLRSATGWTTESLTAPVNHGSCVQRHAGPFVPRSASVRGGRPPKQPGAAPTGFAPTAPTGSGAARPELGAGGVSQPVPRIVRPVRVGLKEER